MKCLCKVSVSVVLLFLVLCTIAAPNPAYAETAGMDVTDETVAAYSEEELEDAYINVINFAENKGIEIGMTFADFLENYNGQEVTEFEESFYTALSANCASVTPASSGGGKYYHDTGLECPEEANYSKYNLLDVVKKAILSMKPMEATVSQDILLLYWEYLLIIAEISIFVSLKRFLTMVLLEAYWMIPEWMNRMSPFCVLRILQQLPLIG